MGAEPILLDMPGFRRALQDLINSIFWARRDLAGDPAKHSGSSLGQRWGPGSGRPYEQGPVSRVGDFSLYLGCERREVTSVPRAGLTAPKGTRPDLWVLLGFGLQGQEPNRGEEKVVLDHKAPLVNFKCAVHLLGLMSWPSLARAVL